nr:cyclophilin-like fold protein [Limosilactobacillus albertensis]
MIGITFSAILIFNQPVKAARQTQIEVQINNHEKLRATLNNSSAARQFSRELPRTMHFRNYMDGYDEKIADLHHPLTTKGMPRGNNAKAGEIGYWSPDRRIVFYWGNVSYYPGIHIIGHFTKNTDLQLIRHLNSSDKITITRVRN